MATTLPSIDSVQSRPSVGPSLVEAATKSKQSYPDTSQHPLHAHPPSHEPGITYVAQEKLPKLPIPDLAATINKYRHALLPLQTEQEQQDTAAAADDFLKAQGNELQERLKEYASGKTSYIEQFWYDSFLNFDNPVVLNLNPFFLLEDDPTPARNNQVTRAASLVISALSFIRAVRREDLPPDTLRGTPLDMYQYSRLFGTARVPTENGCMIGQDSSAKHMVVLCRGQFYWFDALDDDHDLIMTEKDVALNLQVIVDDAEKVPIQEAARAAVGVLSTEDRKTWSGLRDVLTRQEGSNNAECLRMVDSALFVLCLDYTEPANVSDLCGNMLCGTNQVVRGVQVGTCTNRWYDKLQIIVCKNGSAGINFEHTGVDGHTVLRFASDVYTDTILRFARTINGQAPTIWASTSPDPSKREPASFGHVNTNPHKLEWDMVPELRIALRFAETRLADLIHQNEFQTLDFTGYGKSFVTSMGFSPDAFVQMAFQAAYYGLYGRVENTYEPAMTKIFLHGRTEAIRTVTPECVHFVKTFWAEHQPQKKVDALKTATQKHTAITKECGKAQGQDRHLYALYCLWQRIVEEEDAGRVAGAGQRDHEDRPSGRGQLTSRMPSLFTDPGWQKLNDTILSTSNCGNPALRHFGFGPTSADGFGIGYIIKDDSISICASSKHRQTRRLMHSLETYLLEIRKLLRVTNRDAAPAKQSRAREIDEVKDIPSEGQSSNIPSDDGERDRSERFKARGHGRVVVRAHPGKDNGREKGKPTDSHRDDVDADLDSDDGLGGYGFFDAGKLLQALNPARPHLTGDSTSAAQYYPRRVATSTSRGVVGKKLPLNEY